MPKKERTSEEQKGMRRSTARHRTSTKAVSKLLEKAAASAKENAPTITLKRKRENKTQTRQSIFSMTDGKIHGTNGELNTESKARQACNKKAKRKSDRRKEIAARPKEGEKEKNKQSDGDAETECRKARKDR